MGSGSETSLSIWGRSGMQGGELGKDCPRVCPGVYCFEGPGEACVCELGLRERLCRARVAVAGSPKAVPLARVEQGRRGADLPSQSYFVVRGVHSMPEGN